MLRCRVGIEERPQVTIKKETRWIERGPYAPEILPMRIERGQLLGGTCMHFAPVRPSVVAPEDSLDVLEICAVWHATVHMHGDIRRIALVCRAEPDVVAAHKTTLHRKMHAELLLVDALSDLVENVRQVLRGNVVLHLLEAHQARCGEEAVAGGGNIDVGNRLRRDMANRFAKSGEEAAGFREQPVDARSE